MPRRCHLEVISSVHGGLYWAFPGGSVVKDPPANAGHMSSAPGLGRCHTPWATRPACPQLLSLGARLEPLLCNQRSPTAGSQRGAPACCNWREPACGSEDQAQPNTDINRNPKKKILPNCWKCGGQGTGNPNKAYVGYLLKMYIWIPWRFMLSEITSRINGVLGWDFSHVVKSKVSDYIFLSSKLFVFLGSLT